MRKVIVCFVLIIITVFTLSCQDPGWPVELSQDEIKEIFQRIRQGIFERSKPKLSIPGQAFLLTVYNGQGDRQNAGATKFEKVIRNFNKKIKYSSFETPYITLTIVRNHSKLNIEFLADIGFTYEKGLHGIAYAKDGRVKIYDPPYIATRDWSLGKVLKKLKSGAGTLISDWKLDDGFYILTCESYTEPEPGMDPLPLFRANALFETITPERIDQAVVDGGDMLLRLQQPSGRFAYEYFPGKDKLNLKTYNLLRHCGTCYSLFQLYAYTKDPRYLEAGKRGMKWLEGKIKSPSWDPERAYPVYHNKAKLGGAGLALMAYCEWVKVDPEFQVTKLMHKLATHCRKEQKENGSFHTYYSWDKRPVKKRHSIYYPGEAILALIRYHTLVPGETESLEVARKGIDYLVNKRWMILGMEVNVPPDAWLMMALREFWELTKSEDAADYCMRIADVMASDQHVRFVPDADFFGGYFPDPPQVTPAGSRMEGLTAAYILAKKSGKETDWIKDTIVRGATFQVRMQIRREFDHLFPNPQMALGTFRHSPVRSINRIDYNQHNISGLLVAEKILRGEI